jgi:Flp pilus assembly protein TadD
MGLPPQVLLVGEAPADVPGDAPRVADAGKVALAKGDFDAAVSLLRRAVALRPAEPEYHLQLAIAADKGGQDDLVEPHALESIRLAPTVAAPHYVLAAWHYRHGRLGPAASSIEAAAALAPDDRLVAVSRGSILLAAGKPREAWEAMRAFAEAEVPDRWIASLCARAAGAVGQEEQALAVVGRALRASGLSDRPDGRPMLHFAMSALLDKLGRYDEAFGHARTANDAVRAAVRPHDAEAHSEWVTNKIRYFTRRRLKSLPRATHDNRRPVFIVGMPRSGTSLVEQILACHPQVHGAGELNALRQIARGSSGSDWSEGATYPEALDGLSITRANRLAQQYLSAAGAGIDSAAGGPEITGVTDKQPLNFLLLDLVELLFPHCRIIHCVRNAIDTCLSCYLTNFEQCNEFKFDLAHLGGYYRDYRRLMEHWKKVLTVPVLEVRYEDVVLDAEGQTNRMLEFLNLPWDERCMRPHESDRRVRTASLDQVRRPIYTSSINRWKHYEKHLGELIAALGRSGTPAGRAVPV